MSLAQITEKIKKDAQLEADKILAEAKESAAVVTKKAEESCEEIKADFKARFEAERPEIFRRREIVAKLDINKMQLQAKRNLIADVYKTALDQLKSLSKEDYLAFFEKLLESLGAKEGELQLSADEKFIDKAWVDAYNKKAGASLAISDEKADISGGFILEQNRIISNCSLDMLLQVAQEQKETDVIKRLFPTA